MSSDSALSVQQNGGTRVAQPTGLVNYRSQGRCVVLAEAEHAEETLALVRQSLPTMTVSSIAIGTQRIKTAGDALCAPHVSVKGHLGKYRVALLASGETVDDVDNARVMEYDIVIDACRTATLEAEVKAYGYYRLTDEAESTVAFEEIPELIGEFEKPRYISHDANICAHSRRGISGCSRCLEACSASAIISFGDSV